VKKYITITLLLLLCFSTVRAEEKSDYDFRKTRWGMSVEEVKKAEGGTFKKKELGGVDVLLIYDGFYAGLKCKIEYGFKTKPLKLRYGTIYFDKEHISENNYNMFRKQLNKKYGMPIPDSQGFLNYRTGNNTIYISFKPHSELRIRYFDSKYFDKLSGLE
jgi:hypothetical protein